MASPQNVLILFEIFIHQVTFHVNSIAGKIVNINDNADETTTNDKNNDKSVHHKGMRLATVQCFPLYSILLAVGRTRIDYFSLDVEGSETDVLTSTPWHKIYIKVRQISDNMCIAVRRSQRVDSIAFLFHSFSIVFDCGSDIEECQDTRRSCSLHEGARICQRRPTEWRWLL